MMRIVTDILSKMIVGFLVLGITALWIVAFGFIAYVLYRVIHHSIGMGGLVLILVLSYVVGDWMVR